VLLTEPKIKKIESVVVRNINKELDAYNAKSEHEYKLKLSMGLSHYDPESHCTIDNLLINADNLMYENKRARKTEAEHDLAPDEIIEKRQHKRYAPLDPLVVKIDGIGDVSLKDISIGGICMQSSNQLDVNTIHTIDFHGTDNNDMKSEGRVVWSSHLPAGRDGGRKPAKYEAGMKFIEINDVVKTALNNIIDNLTATA